MVPWPGFGVDLAKGEVKDMAGLYLLLLPSIFELGPIVCYVRMTAFCSDDKVKNELT